MHRVIASSFLAITMALQSDPLAEDRRQAERAAITTAKERLASKAADSQRVNDCKVPKAKRNADRPRSDDCAHLKPEAKQATGVRISK
ncbi:MAG: hypothetical protein ACRBM6_04040 [Geminicoccales bacterium]